MNFFTAVSLPLSRARESSVLFPSSPVLLGIARGTVQYFYKLDEEISFADKP